MTFRRATVPERVFDLSRVEFARMADDAAVDVGRGRVAVGEEVDGSKERAEGSLLEFVRLMWPVLEPRQKFVEGWALQAIVDHLEAVSAGRIRDLLINVPPGCMKSLLCNVFWPAWEWGPKNRPDLRIVSASYADHLSIRDNEKFSRLVNHEAYRRRWGDRFELVKDASFKVENDRTGFKSATHVGGATGERGDRLVIDDPHNVQEAESDAMREHARLWFAEVATTRINDASSATVVIMQRLHEGDISGLIVDEKMGFEHLCLPMKFEAGEGKRQTAIGFVDPRKQEGELLWPERFPDSEVERAVKRLSSVGGEFAVAGQHQQRPITRGGGMFRNEHPPIVDTVPAGGFRVRGWDLAASKEKGAAFTVGVKLAFVGKQLYVEDVVRGQFRPEEVEAHLRGAAERDGFRTIQDLPQDPGQSGVVQKQSYGALLNGFDVHFSPETGSKEDRAKPFAAQWNLGNVSLVRAPWNDPFIRELQSFPRSNWKDQVDASSRAYAKVLKLIATAPTLAVPEIVR